jgi:MoxR-like ATPase
MTMTSYNTLATGQITVDDQAVQFCAFANPTSEQRIHLLLRPQPTAGETSNWTDTSIGRDAFMDDTVMQETFLYTNLFTYITNDGEVTVNGIDIAPMDAASITDIENGATATVAIKVAAESLLETPSFPRSWRFDSIAKASEWLVATLLKSIQDGSDLTEYTVHPMMTADGGTTETVEVPEEGVMTRQGLFIPCPGFVPGRTNLDLQVQAFEKGWALAWLGPPGTGKTHLISAAAKVWRGDDRIEVINGGPDIRMHKIVGNWIFDQATGTWKWVDGPLLRAARGGLPLLVDEFGRIPMDVMTIFYSVTDGRGEFTIDDQPELGTIQCAPGFGLVFASNPDLPSFELDEPLASRFAAMPELLTDWDLLRKLVGSKSKTYMAIVDACHNLDKQRQNKTLYFTPQFRDIVRLPDKAEAWGLAAALSELVTRVGRIGTENDQAEVIDTLERALDWRGLSTLKAGG